MEPKPGEGTGTGQPGDQGGQQTPPNPSDSGGGTGTQSGTGTPPAGTGGSGQNGAPPEDLDGLKRTVAATRTEADALKTQLREANEAKKAAEAKVAEFETANQSELEKTKAAAEKAEKALAVAQATARTAIIRSAIMQEATKYAFNDPQDLMLYIDQSKIEIDDEGNPKGIEQMVKKIAEEKKYLLKDERTIIPPPGTSTNTRDGKGLTPDEQKRREQDALQQTRSYI